MPRYFFHLRCADKELLDTAGADLHDPDQAWEAARATARDLMETQRDAELNWLELQRVLNPNPPTSVERFGWRFAPGDRVMQTENDYDREVFNGDLGSVIRIDDEEGALIVEFDGREVTYPFGELETIVLAFATTIHKSQGSEYPAVVIP